MWVLKKINQEQELASGKFSSQSKLAEFMGIHPRTLNKALKEGRNSFQFRGEIVSVHQLQNFQLMILLEIKNSLKRKLRLLSFHGKQFIRQFLFKLNLKSEKSLRKMAKYDCI